MRRHGIRQARVDASAAAPFPVQFNPAAHGHGKTPFRPLLWEEPLSLFQFFYLPYLFLFRFLVFPHCSI
jgi:hypothetical protein